MLGAISRRFSLQRILLLAAALRLIWIWLCPNEPTSDPYVYHFSAEQLAQGYGYVDADGRPAGWWPVGYQALLAPFYWAFGPHYEVAFLVNLVLGLITVWAVYALSDELFGQGAGTLAALVTAVYPTFVLYTTVIASENAVWSGSALFLLLALRTVRAPRFPWRLAVLAGVVLGLSGYVRATTLALSVGLPLLGWWMHLPLRAILTRTAVTAAISVAVLVPWSIRTHTHFDRVTPFSLNGKSNFWMGNHAGSTGGYAPLPATVRGLSLTEREDALMEQAMEFVRAQPGEYLLLCARRIWMTLRSDTIAAVWNKPGLDRRFGEYGVPIAKAGCTASYYLLLALLLTTAIPRRRRGEWGASDTFLAAMVALSAIPFVLIVGGNRYHLPLLLLWMIWIGARATSPQPVGTDGCST